jgi:hypothetical protein
MNDAIKSGALHMSDALDAAATSIVTLIPR